MKNAISVMSLVVALGLAGCGDKVATQTPGLSIEGWNYAVVGDGAKLIHGNTVAGTGAIQFKAELPGGDTNEVSFDFKLEDGGSLLFHSNAKSGLNEGLDFVFSRAGENVTAVVRSLEKTADVSAKLAGKIGSPTGTMSVKIAVHNDEGAEAHIIFSTAGGEEIIELHGDHPEEPSEPAEPHIHSPGKGAGRVWGFTLKGAAVAKVKAVKAEHHHDHDHH